MSFADREQVPPSRAPCSSMLLVPVLHVLPSSSSVMLNLFIFHQPPQSTLSGRFAPSGPSGLSHAHPGT